MPGVRRLDLDLPEVATRVMPGQFLHVAVPNGAGFLRRPLDVLDASPATGVVSLLFQVLGDGTEAIAALSVGETADVMGPLGVGFSAAAGVERVVLIGGGLGVAPFPFLARELLRAGVDVTWANGARRAELLYPEIPAGAHPVLATDDGSAGFSGSILDACADAMSRAHAVYACGPLPMLRALSRRVVASQPGARVEVAVEARMGCARGVCLGCVVPVHGRGYVRSCREGPVFEIREIDWESVADPGERRAPLPVPMVVA
jgi:dihydroorotate dehydrogenase electron transfer subunit